jgi:hypothetical protein
LPDVATLFSGIYSFSLHFSFPDGGVARSAGVNPPRIRHLSRSQASMQLTYRT